MKYVLTLRVTDCCFVIFIYNANKGYYMAARDTSEILFFQDHETRQMIIQIL